MCVCVCVMLMLAQQTINKCDIWIIAGDVHVDVTRIPALRCYVNGHIRFLLSIFSHLYIYNIHKNTCILMIYIYI